MTRSKDIERPGESPLREPNRVKQGSEDVPANPAVSLSPKLKTTRRKAHATDSQSTTPQQPTQPHLRLRSLPPISKKVVGDRDDG